MAQWIRHLTSNQGIPGSSPGRLLIFQLGESSLGLSPGGAGASTHTLFVYIMIHLPRGGSKLTPKAHF